jgi:hypothetical protein
MTFRRDFVLGKVKENREKHRAIFLEAVEGYRTKAIAFFEKQIETIKAGKKIQEVLRMPLPEDHTKDYDRAIQMLQNTVDEEIELDGREFGCYVMDDWEWTQSFYTSNTRYSTTAEAEAAQRGI